MGILNKNDNEIDIERLYLEKEYPEELVGSVTYYKVDVQMDVSLPPKVKCNKISSSIAMVDNIYNKKEG